jgi:hypothetical protein
MSKSQMKTILFACFDIEGIVHFGFIPEGQTVNCVHYLELLNLLCEAVCIKGPVL